MTPSPRTSPPEPPPAPALLRGDPLPPQDVQGDVVYLTRQILTFAPEENGQYLLVRGPFLAVVKKERPVVDIMYWGTNSFRRVYFDPSIPSTVGHRITAFPPFAVVPSPSPPQDSLVTLTREFFASIPDGTGRVLFVEDPYVVLAEKQETSQEILFWCTFEDLQAKEIPLPAPLPELGPVDHSREDIWICRMTTD